MNHFTDALKYARLQARLRWKFIAIWLLSLWSIPAIFAPSYAAYYPEIDMRAPLVAGMQSNLGMRAMYGILGSPGTLGQLVAWEGGGWLTILGTVMGVFLFAGAYRRAEESSLGELPRAVGMHRLSIVSGALVLLAAVSFILSLGAGAILASQHVNWPEMDVEGGFALGAATGATVFGGGILAGLCTLFIKHAGQLVRVGMLATAVSFAARALADVKDIPILNWISPLGWRSVIDPYGANNWVKFIALLGICLIACIILVMLERSREYGSALFHVKQRENIEARPMTSGLRLRWHLDKGLIGIWAVALFAIGFFFMSLLGSMSDLINADDKTGSIFKEMFAGQDLEIAFVAYISEIVGILLAVVGISLGLHQAKDERERLVDLQRSTGIGRTVPLRNVAIMALIGTFLATLVSTIGSMIGAWMGSDNVDTALRATFSSGVSQLGPALALAGLAVFLVGANSKLAGFAWAPIVYSVFATVIGPVLKLPQWMIDASVFGHAYVWGDTGTDKLWIVGGLIVGGLLMGWIGVLLSGRREVS